MSIFSIVVLVARGGLLLLGAIASYALLARALKISDKYGDETNIGTLWGLFILGLSAGVLLVWWALP